MEAPKRLYIFTGKGGVGKTTLSLAFTRWLREQGHQAIYLTLSQQSLSDEKHGQERVPAGWQEIPHEHLELEACAEGYITKKLGSSMIAKWIVRTAFFRALVNMLPGFGYVISMGQVLQNLSDNPKLIVVMDAPASGHALTMMEATKNFREIFQSGMVFDDTEKMLSRLYNTEHTGIRILTLPTVLALQEALELQQAIHKLAPMGSAIYLNHSLSPWKSALTEAPIAIQEKIRLEDEVMHLHGKEIAGQFSYSASEHAQDMYRDLSSQMGSLL